MSRIAVFTLQGPGNYGNRLQNYAVEKILNERFDLVHSIVPTNHVVLKPLQIRLGIVLLQAAIRYGIRHLIPKGFFHCRLRTNVFVSVQA